MEILHNRYIHLTDGPVTESPGRPVATQARDVVCPCGRAGVLASEGHEEEVKRAWAIRNGYDLSEVEVTTA